MSGGVDSSLVASLLVEQGYDVTGVYMKNWSVDLPGMKCPWAVDLADAKRVAVKLGIDFKVFDFEKDYKNRVVNYMIDEYKSGRTPNPDIMCNQEIKFKLFLETALADGADMIATGHYARVSNRETPNLDIFSNLEKETANHLDDNFSTNSKKGVLLRAVDDNKDQTYFLYRVTAEALAITLFPIGEFTKPEVRQMALKRNLVTANKKDSQGICFVGQVGIRDFLGQYVKKQTGDVIDKKTGKKLGVHDGAIFFTIGQRHGLNIGGGLPFYVVEKDMTKNLVYVSSDLNDEALWQNEINLTSVHFINERPKEGVYRVRVRHRAPLVDAMLMYADTGVLLKFVNPERSIAAGQSVVIYDNLVCLGGGIVC